MNAILRAKYGRVPDDWREGYALVQLLWEQGVGTHSRAKERAAEAADAKKAEAYRKSVALLRAQE